MSLVQRMHILLVTFQMIEMVSVMNHCHINGFYLCWDSVYFAPFLFFIPTFAGCFHWSLNDSKCPQISKTLLRILADLDDSVFRFVSILPLISLSSIFFHSFRWPFQMYQLLLASRTIIFHCLFNSLLFTMNIEAFVYLFAFFYFRSEVRPNNKLDSTVTCFFLQGFVFLPAFRDVFVSKNLR